MSGGSHSDSGNALGGGTALATGITVLPNTGNNFILKFISLAAVVIGALVLISAVARIIAKKTY